MSPAKNITNTRDDTIALKKETETAAVQSMERSQESLNLIYNFFGLANRQLELIWHRIGERKTVGINQSFHPVEALLLSSIVGAGIQTTRRELFYSSFNLVYSISILFHFFFLRQSLFSLSCWLLLHGWSSLNKFVKCIHV